MKFLSNVKSVLCAIILATACTCQAMERIAEQNIFAPSRLGKVSIYHDEDGFHVHSDTENALVKRHMMSSMLRNLDAKHLKGFLEQGGYISLEKCDDGEYSLTEHVRGLGGGPVGFAIGYGITKALIWSGIIGAGVGAVAATGGAALGVAGVVGTGAAATTGALAATGSAIAGSVGIAGGGAVAGAVGVGAAAGFTAGATAVTAVGTTIAAGAAAGATVTGAATVAAVASAPTAVATVAAAGGVIASIEAASLCVGAWVGALTGPF